MANPLQFSGYDKNTARSFLIVGIGSQIVYSIEAIREVMYEQYLSYMGINNTELGILFTISCTSYFLFLLFGWIHSLFQAKHLLCFGLIGSAIIGFFLFLVPQLGFRALVPVFILASIREVALWPATLNYVRSFSSPQNQGSTFSLYEFLRRVAAIALNILVILCVSLFGGYWGIRTAILLESLAIVAVLLLTLKYIPKIQRPHQSGGSIKAYVTLVKKPEIWLVGICGMAITANFYVLLIIVPFLRGGFNLNSATAGIIALVSNSVIGALSCLFSGILADKLFKSPSRMIKYTLYALLVVVMFLLFLPKSPLYIASCIIAICLMAAVVYSLRGLTFAPLAEIGIEQEHSGAALSIASFISLSPGLWMHMFNGRMLDIFKENILMAYNIMFILCTFLNILAIISSHRLDRVLKKKHQDESFILAE
ncbi:MAG: MFS transporter [Brevinema sp.]